MSLVMSCSKIICTRVNNVYKFGGYLSRGMASIEDYKIKWKRPEKIPVYDRRQSGDQGLDVNVEPSEIKLYYRDSNELKDANELVKKVFSVGFQTLKESRDLQQAKIMALVKRHICDRGSTEVQIAAMTSTIQDLQKHMLEHPRNKKTKVFLKELVEKRRKYLKLLRKWDYRRFEWILERLNLVYIPQPMKGGMVSRKDSIRKMTQNYCDNIVQEKLDAYKAELKEQQKLFYADKAEKLAFILKEERECGLTPTVTEEDIENALNKAKELSQSNDV